MGEGEQNPKTQSNWLLFFLFLLFIYRKDMNRLNFQEITLVDLEKKSELLNRIRGYLDPQEQHIVHSAEIILQIIAKIKILMDLPQAEASEVRYSALNLKDRKRSMLIDLSEFLEDEKKLLVHKVVDLDVKVQALEEELGGTHELSQGKGFMSDINNYIEIFESTFSDGTEENAAELKKIVSILKIINVLKNREKINETDIIEFIYPFIGDERKDSLMRMIRAHGGTNDISDEKKN